MQTDRLDRREPRADSDHVVRMLQRENTPTPLSLTHTHVRVLLRHRSPFSLSASLTPTTSTKIPHWNHLRQPSGAARTYALQLWQEQDVLAERAVCIDSLHELRVLLDRLGVQTRQSITDRRGWSSSRQQKSFDDEELQRNCGQHKLVVYTD